MSTSGSLDQPLARAGIPGLQQASATKLARKGVRTVRDLLEYVPRNYLNLSNKKEIRDLKIGEQATILGTVKRVDGRYLRGRKHMLSVKVGDGTGFIEIVFWNQPFRARTYTEGMTVAVAGRFDKRAGKLQVSGQPIVEIMRGDDPGVHTGRIIPVHPATEGVSTTMIRRAVHSALKRYGKDVEDPLPPDLLKRRRMPTRAEALEEMHFPTSRDRFRVAKNRLVFEELFVLQAGLGALKRRVEKETRGMMHVEGGELVGRFLSSLPFTATGAQRRTVDEIRGDMAEARPMHRLLQGEVGSGKTVVAVAAALAAAGSGSQTAFMAPTEVLAEQHFLTVRKLLEPLADQAPVETGRLFGEGFGVELLTSAVTGKARERALEETASGRATLLVGTHALIQEGVQFHRLGLAIVDEQHRFGVHQRIALRAKGVEDAEPDLLIMTATPIPRTLAMTLYGDLDVSVLDEMPPGRRPVRTRVIRGNERDEAYDLIRAEVGAGRQAFIVCPLVSESEALEVKAATTEYERISGDVFPDLRVALIHGRMRPAEKDSVMTAMRAGEVDVLVATTVIEVGVDIPNATVMLIEDADRFGLSQLHQLRGRIGRSEHQATCLLLTSLDETETDERRTARERLAAMEASTDGLVLAEKDLELRGEGQLFGKGAVGEETGAPAQAGQSDLRFASPLVRHVETLAEARKEAFALVDDDPHLSDPGHAALRDEVVRRFGERLGWLFAG
ncbi:MAG: ATP-dependent DNA helicase RecG [Actinomycetota bacterium]